jgi:hypothetical protein
VVEKVHQTDTLIMQALLDDPGLAGADVSFNAGRMLDATRSSPMNHVRRALLSGGRGRRFNSSHSDQLFPSQFLAFLRIWPWLPTAENSRTLREPAV